MSRVLLGVAVFIVVSPRLVDELILIPSRLAIEGGFGIWNSMCQLLEKKGEEKN